jgi:glutaredoxin
MFHNNSGPMCLEAKEFFKDQNIPFEEYLIEEADFTQKLEEKKQAVGNKSEGVSSSFGYYPIIFVGQKAFSGFNAEIGKKILDLYQP